MHVLLAHPGTQHAPRLARELDRLGLLGEFWTGLALRDGGLLAVLAHRLRRWPAMAGLAARVVPGINSGRLHTMPLVELNAVRRLRAGHDSHSTLHERNRRFQEQIPEASLAANDAVIGFDTSSWILAERARQRGRPFCLDRTIAHPAAFARIMAGFNRQFPDWAVALEERPAMVADAEAREHELAARIVVGGSFARDTLVRAGIPSEKIRVNPYGVDWAGFAAPVHQTPASRPFRFLYVGSVVARKGVPVLLEAWRRLAPADSELWIVGNVGPRERRLIPDLPGLKLFGQTPRARLPALYAQTDVFVLPSFFEGFGLVLLEALAAGLPIIATPHTGAVELLRQPCLGELVTAGSVDELVAAMERWRTNPNGHRAKLAAAVASLADDFSWAAYGERWKKILAEVS